MHPSESQSSKSISHYREAVFLGGGLLLAFAVYVNLAFPEWTYRSLRLFSVIDELTANILLLLSIVIYFQPLRNLEPQLTSGIMASLVSIGILLEFKSFTEDLAVSVWLDNFSQLVGAFFISFVFIPLPIFLKRRLSYLIFAAVLVSTSLSFFILFFSSYLPKTHVADVPTFWPCFINVVSGILFLFATYFFYRPLGTGNREYSVLSIVLFYFGVSGILFPTVKMWGPKWWLTQVYQMVPAIFALAYIVKYFREQYVRTNRLYEELKGTYAQLERFSSIAAHDLKSPLNTIRSFTQLIQLELKEYPKPELQEYLACVSSGTSRLRHLIDDLLDYSRANQRKMKFETVNSSEIVKEVLQSFSLDMIQNQIEVQCRELPLIWGNKTQVFQLFQNLIGNAIKYRSKDSPHLIISAIEKGEEWVFQIEDNGIGIDSEASEKIFEPFQRLHSGRQYEGTGLGLSICKAIVERHGGKIWVTSEKNKGSRFSFSLPKSERNVLPVLPLELQFN